MKYRKIAVKEKQNNIIQATKDSLLNELLSLRGIKTQGEIEKFLNPKKSDFISPYAFLDMKKAVDLKIAYDNAIEIKDQLAPPSIYFLMFAMYSREMSPESAHTLFVPFRVGMFTAENVNSIGVASS